MNTTDLAWVMKAYGTEALNSRDSKKMAYALRNDFPTAGNYNNRIVYADSLGEAIELYKNAGLNTDGTVVCYMSAEVKNMEVST